MGVAILDFLTTTIPGFDFTIRSSASDDDSTRIKAYSWHFNTW
jgi:hypothetical protein